MSKIIVHIIKGESGAEYSSKVERVSGGEKPVLLEVSLEEAKNEEYYLEKFKDQKPDSVEFKKAS